MESSVVDLNECYMKDGSLSEKCALPDSEKHKNYIAKIPIRTHKYTCERTLFGARSVKTTLILEPGTKIHTLDHGTVITDKVKTVHMEYCPNSFYTMFRNYLGFYPYVSESIFFFGNGDTKYTVGAETHCERYDAEFHMGGIYSCTEEMLEKRWNNLSSF
jgi:hypothetical protein